ncbi:hypothetical protein [Flavobacterium sp. LM4]|uniref:hypothetical protein n=1 Tax=Flavobacterium sp. LM4 TaxID=1938609 RepID=UPI000993DFDE|nr:hypothetical protein [Flavobacterium sp. LM4]OOV19206.1 hypothetical protein BXU10_05920 [Flavobacterium sp. LM4]
MKTIYKLIFYSTLILIISDIGITYWYISDHLLSDVSAMDTQSIMNIAINIGIVGGLIPTFSFLILNFLIKKIKNIWLLAILIIILIALVIAIVYWFVLCAVFQDSDNPQYFLYTFLGL